MTLNSELFVQSDRLAAFAVTGSQRYLLHSTVGVTFPFLIVSTVISTDPNRLPAMPQVLLSHLYPSSLSQKALKSYCFLLFACVCMVGCLYTFFILPETKEKTLLEISNEFKAITICGKSPETKGAETKL